MSLYRISGIETPMQVFENTLDFNQVDHSIVFCNANGFPPGSYKNLLSRLHVSRIYAPKFRPLWQPWSPDTAGLWRTLSDDLIELIEALQQQSDFAGKPVTLVGHSLGATVALIAAHKRPELFKRLILMEPVLLSKKLLIPAKLMPKRMIQKRSPLAVKTLRRQDFFDTQQQAFEFHRKARVFNDYSDEALWDYIEAGTEPVSDGQGFKLSYCKYWEAAFYQKPPWLWHILHSINVDTVGIRAQRSDTLTQGCWRKWQQLQTRAQYVEMKDCGHLMAMSHPEQTAKVLNRYLTD
ncbi:alpha/beta fold hydrolase [Paraferrimonas haliotis]|uniref:Alpha/beta hydrolase n=1 Tax=Paraferrimonas haliotis TaxID=2013866 RepID=A0AA37TUL7_9GAMM|nr:alpha/beta hydrolase [Paraferrimonas haliotis]GLS82061.1 alpha/beta hydrolase [Paraferrimonas haliotis]